MTDLVLVLSNLLFGVSILVYFYLREVKNRKDDSERIEKLDMFYSQTVESLSVTIDKWTDTLEKISTSKDNLFHKTLLEYIKHNERLEKLILPQPVTRRAVQDILDQTPQIVPNEIDKIEAEVQQDELNELLTRIPIGKNTKVAFEGDTGLPEEIDEDAFSGKLSE